MEASSEMMGEFEKERGQCPSERILTIDALQSIPVAEHTY